MAISHEARKKLDLILNKHYDGDLLTQQALNDIIAVFDGEVNNGGEIAFGMRAIGTNRFNLEEQLINSKKMLDSKHTGNNERRLQIATQLLAGIIGGSFEHRSVEKQEIFDNASDRVKYALLHADRLIEMAEAK